MTNLFSLKKRSHLAQSSLEYVALITVVAAVILLLMGEPLRNRLEQAFTGIGDKIVHEINSTQ